MIGGNIMPRYATASKIAVRRQKARQFYPQRTFPDADAIQLGTGGREFSSGKKLTADLEERTGIRGPPVQLCSMNVILFVLFFASLPFVVKMGVWGFTFYWLRVFFIVTSWAFRSIFGRFIKPAVPPVKVAEPPDRW